METAKQTGNPDARKPEVAVLFNVKLSGEAAHRPALRIPPLNGDKSVSYTHLRAHETRRHL
eukprot:11104313-Prorocentrum_lima.AAC.1